MPPSVSLDVESYSEAGYLFCDGRWRSVAGSQQGGLPAVGAAVYAEHPTAELLMACYSFDAGATIHTWVPGMPNPEDLLEHARSGGLVYAFNSMFEWLLWDRVCRRRYGWPEMPLGNMRCTMSMVRAYGLPGALASASSALGMAQRKDSVGKGLIRRFCVPRNPTMKDPSLRNYLGDDHENAFRFYGYCAQDVRVEAGLQALVPPLSDYESDVWKLDQRINERGVAVDTESMHNCLALVDAMTERLHAELVHLTNGRIQTSGQVTEMQKMLTEYGVFIPDMTADTLTELLENPKYIVHAHPWARRMLEIRQALASASVKKLNALERTLSADGRVRGLFMYGGAERTLRWAGRGAQPQNFPRGNASIVKCKTCGIRQGSHRESCGACGGAVEGAKWNFKAATEALETFQDRNLDNAISRWGDVLGVMAGTLRSLFIAAPGHELVCSDYRAIEAVVLAALAGEEWRLEVFQTHGKIYEMSASKITGIPLEDYLEYKRVNGEHHPHRQAIGKVAELASGYGGGPGAWKAFDAEKYMSEDEIKLNIKKWRDESPMIVAMWGGLERAALTAIDNPGYTYPYRDIQYHYDGKVLRCVLPSGRALVYHSPRIEDIILPWGAAGKRIRFWGWNSNPKYGPISWNELETYGGRLTENVVQAVSRDIMAHGMLNSDRAGYRIVLHVHDEVVAEQPIGQGSVAELEACMGDLPAWAKDWPVIAHGGWRGREYRKD